MLQCMQIKTRNTVDTQKQRQEPHNHLTDAETVWRNLISFHNKSLKETRNKTFISEHFICDR
jgi:hypothetical protein